jgi:putative ABC transport system permease protein
MAIMASPRWRKVVRDLWNSKLRTFLVALSIAIGVFAVGAVTQTFTTVQRQLVVEYPKSNPASATLITDPFDDELLYTIRRMEGIEYAEGRAISVVKVRTGPDRWQQMLLFAIPDFNHIEIDKIFPQPTFPTHPQIGAERGVWPPPEHGVLIERASFLIPTLLPASTRVGDSIEIETNDGRRHSLLVAGLAHEPGRIPATFASAAYGYITRDTLEWLTGTRQMDQLSIVVAEDKLNKKHITQIAEEVRAKVENSGRTVASLQVPDPGKHPLQDIFQSLLLILNALGLSALFLSGFLIVNTISALLGQQVRQIGIMKAVGARRGQIAGMYLTMVVIYGILALLIAVPASAWLSGWTAQLLAGFINVDFPGFAISPSVVVVQAVIALLFPILASILPVLSGTRITVREAITDYGISEGGRMKRQGKTQNAKGKSNSGPRLFTFAFCLLPLFSSFIPHPSSLISRPLRLSLRNTFRRRGRLALTLTTLVLSGAIFIGVFSVHGAMLLTLDDALNYWKFDVLLPFNRAYPSELVEQIARQVPGVVHAESWGLATVRRLRADDSESQDLTLFAPPPNTTMLQPTVIQGRWLAPEDENALVISNATARAEPDLQVGNEITLKISGKKSQWRIVGVVRVVGNFGGVGTVYANYPYYARVTGQVGRATTIQVVTDKHDAAYEQQIQKGMEASYKQAGIRFGGGLTSGMIRQQNELFFNILVALLLVMAVLMAAVGGLGLMGTMTLNVLERTREIGVMRAIGASNGSVRQIVLAEGVLIGGLSWLIGALLAVPFGQLLSEALGNMIFEMPLHYVVSTNGILIWFLVVMVIAVLASLLPAHNATRLTVRQVLAYE